MPAAVYVLANMAFIKCRLRAIDGRTDGRTDGVASATNEERCCGQFSVSESRSCDVVDATHNEAVLPRLPAVAARTGRGNGPDPFPGPDGVKTPVKQLA